MQRCSCWLPLSYTVAKGTWRQPRKRLNGELCLRFPSSGEICCRRVRKSKEGHSDRLRSTLVFRAVETHPATFSQRASSVFRYCWPLPTPSEQPFLSKQAWQIFPHLPRTLASYIVLPKSPSQASHLPMSPAQYFSTKPPLCLLAGEISYPFSSALA